MARWREVMNPEDRYGDDLLSEIDFDLMEITWTLTPSQRIQRWYNARQLAVGLRLGQLQQQYPHLSLAELNLKMIESFDEQSS